MAAKPLVSILTPVYNGHPYLTQCIESVLGQTYAAWEHIIVNNCSTDDTLSVAEGFAARDHRVRVFSNAAFLSLSDNWNEAARKLSPASRYCMILPADDWLAPTAVEEMVAVAASSPSIAIVGSLMHRGNRIECGGLPTDRTVFTGREVVRGYLRQEVFPLAPTGNMMRSDLVRARDPLFTFKHQHADLALFLELLPDADFGFVHKPVFHSRVHPDSETAKVAVRRQTLVHDWLIFLLEYGPLYFSANELALLRKQFVQRYYRLLVRGAVTFRGSEFLEFHRSGLRRAGLQPGPFDLVRAGAAEVWDFVRHPVKSSRFLRDLLDRSGTIPERDVTAHL
jgi:glycosyltransferase involved in cell wall biosynthesis